MRWHRRHRAPSPSPSGARATHPHRPRLLSPAGERAALGPAPPCFLLPPFPSYCDIVPSFISGHHSSRVHSFTQRYHTFTPVTLYIVRTRPLSPLGLLPYKQNHTTQRSPYNNMRYQSALVLSTLAAGSAASSGLRHASFHKRQ